MSRKIIEYDFSNPSLIWPFPQICQETAARDGLMKMKQVYESNPALGDPMSIQGQLTDNGQRLDKLRAEQKKYQVRNHCVRFQAKS